MKPVTFYRRASLVAPCIALAGALAACGSLLTKPASADATATATPIKHLVVIYGENVSFDHYFGTYPNATNPPGEPAFNAAPGTPAVNGLTGELLTRNPNLNPANGDGAANPFRLDRSQAWTADQNHAYTAEQQAGHHGALDLFPKYTGTANRGGSGTFGTKGLVMGYYDGNTVTALWNYAQHYAMSDNAWTTTYGPSTPGALEIVAAQTNGYEIVKTTKQPSTVAKPSYYIADGAHGLTMINDVDPAYDVCSKPTDNGMIDAKNVGDLLNERNVTWGGFMAGFDLQTTNPNGTTGCKRATTPGQVPASVVDYIPHHNWFQYFRSTSNPQHTRPSSLAAIGHSVEADGKTPEPANHQYDTDDFFAAVKAGNYPSVSFLKAPAGQDAHAGYSDPLDEQGFVTKVVNFLMQQPDWKNTAVIVTYDDSDGWYDHQFMKPVYSSHSAADQLDGNGVCGDGTPPVGVAGAPVNGRCGPGTRIPFLVISPWAKANYVDHAFIDQSSIVRFIEDNWLGGARLGGGAFDATAGDLRGLFDFSGCGNLPVLYLDPEQGTPVSEPPSA